MSPTNELVSLAAGVVLPFIAELICRDIKSYQLRFVAVLVLCIVVGAILNWDKLVTGSLEGVLDSLPIIFTSSQVVFKLYFKDSWLRSQMQREPDAVIQP